jgi:hypothetical protein
MHQTTHCPLVGGNRRGGEQIGRFPEEKAAAGTLAGGLCRGRHQYRSCPRMTVLFAWRIGQIEGPRPIESTQMDKRERAEIEQTRDGGVTRRRRELRGPELRRRLRRRRDANLCIAFPSRPLCGRIRFASAPISIGAREFQTSVSPTPSVADPGVITDRIPILGVMSPG